MVAALLLLLGPGSLGAHTSAEAAAAPACSTYPDPGTIEPAGTAVPAAIRGRYSLFTAKSGSGDAALVKRVAERLPASGLIAAGARRIGREGNHAVLYAIPAEHYLPYPIAPPRCLPTDERTVVSSELKLLKADYKQPALCVVAVGGSGAGTRLANCAPVAGAPEALLDGPGTPLIGLAPNNVRAVTARYLQAPIKTISVRRNFYEILGKSQEVPCGLEWLDNSGNVTRSIEGCDYLGTEEPLLSTYRQQVTTQLATVQSDVGVMATAIAAGNESEAQADWLTAHMAWLEIGQDDQAYGAFGPLGGKIDGDAAGLLGGTSSHEFTGFHRVELDLWTDHDMGDAAADTATLQALLAKLIAVPIGSELPLTATGVGNWVLRPHEILEDALRDTLTGDDDYGSGTAMASVVADAGAVKSLLTLLAPTLNPLAPGLVGHADGELATAVRYAQATQSNGSWVALSAIPTLARERVDAAVGAAAETLARVPDVLTGTGKSAPLS